jgi:hydrogenase nickel incorporation protein HypA/HybF
MHEFALVMSMLDLAERSARAEGATRIEAIHLEIGALAGVVPEALDFAFGGAKQGTMAEGARLEVDYLPAIAHCASCEADFELDNRFGIALCPICDTPSAELRQGRELQLSHLEVA